MKLVLCARYWRGLLAVLAVAAGLGAVVADPTASASPSTNKPSCNLVSPALIKKVLGFSAQPPQVTVSGNELTCRYQIPKLYQSVAVHLTSGMTPQSFQYFRNAYNKTAKTTNVKGLGQEAWASVVSLYGATASTLAVLEGSEEIMVQSPGPLAPVEALARAVLPKI
jgi:hypothetical protein